MTLREEIEAFFCGRGEAFTDPEAQKQKLLALIDREKRKAVEEAFRPFGDFFEESTKMIREAREEVRRKYPDTFPPHP